MGRPEDGEPSRPECPGLAAHCNGLPGADHSARLDLRVNVDRREIVVATRISELTALIGALAIALCHELPIGLTLKAGDAGTPRT
jgi:hypothetical protein